MYTNNNNLTLQEFLEHVNRGLTTIYFTTSLISVIFVLFVIVSVIFVPRLRRHPGQLLFQRTLLDLVICLCHIIEYAAVVNRDGNPTSDTSYIDKKCRPLSVIYQIALFGSNSWYFILSVDLLLAVRNPFRSHSDVWTLVKYCAFVYLSSLVSGLILLGSKQYGLSLFNYCWVKDTLVDAQPTDLVIDLANKSRSASAWVWGIYYGPHLILCIFSIGFGVIAMLALKQGLPASSETRRRVVKFGFCYVAAFAVEWFLRLSLYIAQDQYLLGRALRDPDQFKGPLHNTAAAYAAIEGLRGVVDFFLWFGTSSLTLKEIHARCQWAWTKWRKQDVGSASTMQDPLIDGTNQVEVASVLRHDMMTCTSWGIVDSAPVNLRPPNLTVTGFEESLRQSIAQKDVPSDKAGHVGEQIPGDQATSSKIQVSGFESQRSELQLWLKTAEGVRTRRIHCPTALQNTKFDFRDYAPDVFSCIRSLRGVDPTTYSRSFSVSKSKHNTAMMEKFTEGRSGSFFYFTHDSRYIVKTVSSSEVTLLNQHIRDYFFYLHSNPDSLLTRFFGLHAMRLSWEQKYISFMVMENIFPASEKLRPNERYDLKGSWVSRRALKGKNADVPISKMTLKDCDLKRKIRIGPEAKARLLAQLKRDVGFLASLGIMDYSLLVGIRDFENDPREELEADVGKSGSCAASGVRHPQDPSLSMGYVPPSPLTSAPRGGGTLRLEPPTFTPLPRSQETPQNCTPWHRSFHGGLLGLPPKSRTLYSDASVTESALHELGSVATPGDSVQPEEKVWSIYYMGLIDILQRYNLTKKLEHCVKAYVLCLDAHGISAVSVNEYAERFIRAMDRIFE